MSESQRGGGEREREKGPSWCCLVRRRWGELVVSSNILRWEGRGGESKS